MLAVTNTGGQIRGLIRDEQFRELAVLDVCYEAVYQCKLHRVLSSESNL